MDQENLKYWLAWNKIAVIGPKRFYQLLKIFGSAKNAWQINSAEIAKRLKLSNKISLQFSKEKRMIDPERNFDLLKKYNVKILTIKDSHYPQNLKEIHLPPPILYYIGNITDRDKNSISIVGSRKATYYGKMVAEKFSKDLALAGLTIVSGLARGIDTVAHKGALSVRGRTIAVLGCGIDIPYPPENRKLIKEIEESGAVITEFPLSALPERQNFPRRNRIISGLSLGTLVVEAAEKSGALITTDFALEQGREVFAIPGNITSQLSKGTHNLIKQGGKLVNNYKDILEEIPFVIPEKSENREVSPNLSSLSKEDLIIYNLLSNNKAVQIDEITEICELSANKVSSILLNLELKDLIKEIEGKNYIKQ